MTPEEQSKQKHHLLVDLCHEIGAVAGSNFQFTRGLTGRITAAGKSIEDLTVRELMVFIQQHREFYNKVYSR